MDSAASGLPVALSPLGRTGGEPAIVLPGGPCRGPEYLGDLAGVGEERPLVVMHPRGTRRSGGLSRGWWRDAADRIRAALPTRVLVVGGDRDLLTGVQPVRDYAALLGGRLEMIADCGHYPWVERPDEFRRALAPWLRGGL